MRSAINAAPVVFCACFLIACSQDPERPCLTARVSLPVIGGVVDDGPSANEAVVLLTVGQGACSGTLVAPNVVLTARHCVSQVITTGIACDPNGNSLNGDHVGMDYPPENIKVFTGLEPPIWGGTPDASGALVFHPDGNILCNADIAIVVLDHDVLGIDPRTLRFDYGALLGELVMVVGYGQSDASTWSTGVRHRRGDIPVVSSGYDWNYLSGANEFVLGQSTCQGDSGGPAFAMSTGALLGITSRGGDCFTDVQHFTRVDRHAALIQEAFDAAGQTPLLEGVPAPTPPTKKANGEGPCSAGAECESGACLDVEGTPYCSEIFCSEQKCSYDMICLPTQFATFSEDISACVWIPDGTECETCRFNKCKSELERCYQGDDCIAIVDCVDACTTDACRDACVLQNAGGEDDYASLRTCACQYKCPGLCDGQCGGGAGGAGGAGGEAGAAGASGAAIDGGAGASGSETTQDAGGSAPSVDALGEDGGCSTAGRDSLPRGSVLVWIGVLMASLLRRR